MHVFELGRACVTVDSSAMASVDSSDDDLSGEQVVVSPLSNDLRSIPLNDLAEIHHQDLQLQTLDNVPLLVWRPPCFGEIRKNPRRLPSTERFAAAY